MNENNNVYQESQKNNYVQGIITGILICLVVCLTAFIIYDKVLSKEEINNNNNQQESNNTENEQTKETSVTLTALEQESLLNKIDIYNSFPKIVTQYPISDINSLDNATKLQFLSQHIAERADNSFTKENLKETANNYFYNGFNFTNEDIMCGIEEHESLAIYLYNGSTGTYTYNGGDDGLLHGHGGAGSYRNKSYYVNGAYNESTKLYTFDIKVLYADYCSDVCGPYTKFYSDVNQNNMLYQIGDVLEEFDDVYPKIKDELPVTKYSFYKNSDGSFVLKSVGY